MKPTSHNRVLIAAAFSGALVLGAAGLAAAASGGSAPTKVNTENVADLNEDTSSTAASTTMATDPAATDPTMATDPAATDPTTPDTDDGRRHDQLGRRCQRRQRGSE